jgi:hypothetical protein
MTARANGDLNAPLFTRFVRRRNFAGFPFCVSASPDTCALLMARARDYAREGFRAGVRLADCAPAALGLYREQGLLPERPVSFEGKRDFKMLFPGVADGEHALFGEVEHWTHVRFFAGMPGPEAAGGTGAGPWARSATYGFLTSNPAFAGTGLQLEAALHLPVLALERRIHAVQKSLGAMGYDLEPLSLRTPGSAESGHFRLLSRGGMDLPEEVLHARFAAKAESVLAAESRALEQWHTREPNRLEDHAHRALRLLQEARRMEYAELLSLVSYARIGVYLGILPENLREPLETLRVRGQSFHVRASLSDAASEAENKARAESAREILSGIQPLPTI